MARPDNNLGSNPLAAALRSVGTLGTGGSPVQPITAHQYQPTAGTYEGGPRAMLAQSLSPGPGKSAGGGGGGGGAGRGAGLEKLGGGIAQAVKGFAAKRAQQQQYANAIAAAPPRDVYDKPSESASLGSPSAGAMAPTEPTAPYSPSPVGASGDVPTFAQPNAGTGEMGSSIGQATSLPSFSAGVPSAPSVPPAPARGIVSGAFEPHHGARNVVSAGDFFNALVQRGASPVAAAAITGNATFESGARPGQVILDPATDAGSRNWGTGSAAVGAMQWEGDRKAGVAPTLDSQADHIVSELKGGRQGLSFGSLNAMTDPRSAAYAVNHQFERPQYPLQSDAQRQRYADQTYRQYGQGGGQLAGPSPTSNTVASQPPASGAAAYAATSPSLSEPQTSQAQNLPAQISPGQPQNGPAYSDDTWANRPQFDYGGGQPQSGPGLINGGQPGVYSVPDLQPPTGPDLGQQGMMQGMPQTGPDQSMLAMALAQQNNPIDFGNFGLGFGGGLFG